MTSWKRLLFGCGQLGVMLLTRYLLMWILDFGNQSDPASETGLGASTAVLLSAAWIGTALFAFRIFDGVTDPLAGMLSDGWVRTGRERRHLLLLTFLIPPIGLALCFAPTFGMPPTLRWTLLLLGMFVYFVGYTFYAIPYWSLISDYSRGSDDERRVLSNILGAALMIATGVGFGLTPLLIDRYGFGMGALILAVPCALLMLGPYFAKPHHTVPAQHLKLPVDELPAPLTMLKDALSHRRFLAVLIIFAGSQMSFTVMTSAAPFIAVDVLGGARKDVAMILSPFLGTAIPSFIVAPYLSRRFGWQRCVLVASLLLGVVYATTASLGQAVIGTPLTTTMILFSLGGPMAAVILGLEGEAITACANEGDIDATSVYFGVFNFLVKALNGLAVFIAGLLITLSQDPEIGAAAIRAMGLVAGSLLALGVVLYFLIHPRGD